MTGFIFLCSYGDQLLKRKSHKVEWRDLFSSRNAVFIWDKNEFQLNKIGAVSEILETTLIHNRTHFDSEVKVNG